jgi:hypothetical protein
VLDRLRARRQPRAARRAPSFFDACLKSQRSAEARALLDSMAARFPVPPSRRVGYAAAVT